MLRINKIVGPVLRDFLTLFYPDYCLGCSGSLVRGEKLICSRCMVQMPQTHYHIRSHNPLKLRLAGRIPLTHALAFFRFNKRGKIQHILHALKYKNQPEVGVVLGKVYGQKLKETHHQFDVIISVPLHSTRLRRRGYNQSSKFAEGLSLSLGVPFVDRAIMRKVRTETQTRKTKLKRWENVNAVFDVVSPEALQGKHVLLVDDVVTTGATLEACGLLILASGCRSLSIAAIAAA